MQQHKRSNDWLCIGIIQQKTTKLFDDRPQAFVILSEKKC